MSHLLYLHSFAWDRFVTVFGANKKANVDTLMKSIPVESFKATPVQIKALITKAVTKGIDRAGLSKEHELVLDVAIDTALEKKAFGIPKTPLSSMGTSAAFLDAFEDRFKAAKATKLLAILRRGQNYEAMPNGSVAMMLFSPEEVVATVKVLEKIASLVDPDDADENEELFAEELLEPFRKVAKKKDRGIRGKWG